MSFQEVLKATRDVSPYSQKEIGLMVGVGQSAWSKYENGTKPIPDDVAIKAMEILKNPRLKIAYESEKQSDLISMPFLNNVDENAVVILDAVIEEAEELIINARALKKIIRNKKCREDFTLSEWECLVKCEEQIADLIPALKLHFVVMAERFGLDLNRISLILKAKFKRKKYIL